MTYIVLKAPLNSNQPIRTPVGNAFFEFIFQCVSRYTATHLVYGIRRHRLRARETFEPLSRVMRQYTSSHQISGG